MSSPTANPTESITPEERQEPHFTSPVLRKRRLWKQNLFERPEAVPASLMRDDFTEMGFSKKDIRELMSIKEPNVDSTGNRPKGVEDAGEARRKRRERGRCYESLFVEGGRANWVLFDPLKGFPKEYGEPPRVLAALVRYQAGNERIVEYNLVSHAVRCRSTPGGFEGREVDYTPDGPRLRAAAENKKRSRAVKATATPAVESDEDEAETAEALEAEVEEPEPTTAKSGRPPTTQQDFATVKSEDEETEVDMADLDEPELSKSKPPPAEPKKRGRPPKTRPEHTVETSESDIDELSVIDVKPAAEPKRRGRPPKKRKLERAVVESAEEEPAAEVLEVADSE